MTRRQRLAGSGQDPSINMTDCLNGTDIFHISMIDLAILIRWTQDLTLNVHRGMGFLTLAHVGDQYKVYFRLLNSGENRL